MYGISVAGKARLEVYCSWFTLSSRIRSKRQNLYMTFHWLLCFCRPLSIVECTLYCTCVLIMQSAICHEFHGVVMSCRRERDWIELLRISYAVSTVTLTSSTGKTRRALPLSCWWKLPRPLEIQHMYSQGCYGVSAFRSCFWISPS